MSFPRYPKYKSSGVEWLGEVPEHWEVSRLKAIVEESLKYGANESAELDDPTLPRFVRITDIGDDGGLREDTFKSLPVEIAEPYLLKEGDVLLARSGATVGKSFIYSKQWGTACFAGYLIRARLKQVCCIPKWLYYFCQTDSYWGYVLGSQIQATIQNVSAEKYSGLRLPLPSPSEQTRIVEFLDRETGKIDELVAEQQRLMELLKEKRQAVISHAVTKGLNPRAPMKPSGIEWLGDVPEHWEVTRIKKLASMISKGTTPTTVGAEFTDDGVRFLKAENVTETGVSAEPAFFISQESHNLLSRSSLDHGDVLVVIAGATTGKSAVLGADLLPANTNQAVSFIRPRDRRFSEHIHLWLGTTMVRNLITLNSVQSAQPNLSMEDLGNLPLPIPPSEELEAIRSYLTKETSKLDALAAEAQKAIDLLQERRTALISAAVTGQIDVRKLAAA
jgi:type I restriction enzyme S subunit